MVYFALKLKLLISLISKPIWVIFGLLREHLRAHHFALDPIKDCASIDEVPTEFDRTQSMKERMRQNVHYFVPFVSLVCLNLDTIRVMYGVGFKYNSTGIPELFTHKIYPRELWFQGDMVANVGIQVEMLCFGLLAFTAQLDPRYCLYAVSDSRGSRIYSNGKGNVHDIAKFGIILKS